jgi:hypothetical protein
MWFYSTYRKFVDLYGTNTDSDEITSSVGSPEEIL